MTLKLLIFGCLLTASLITAVRYGVSRGGRYEGVGGYGHHSHGGGFGGHGGHPPPHSHGNFHQGHGHGGFHHCNDCPQGHDHRLPYHDHHHHHHGHGHFQDLKVPQFPHGHDHGHPQQPQQPQIPEVEVNFMIYEPDGMQAWIVQRPDVVFFGIELYVNIEPSKVGAKCDLCANTTVISNGKLIIEKLDVVVKKGDVLHYYALIGNGHSVVRQKLQTLQVTELFIGKCNCLGTSDTQDIDLRFNENGTRTGRSAQLNFGAIGVDTVKNIFGTTKRPVNRDELVDDPQRVIQTLEQIIESMRVKCSAKTTNKLILLKTSFEPINDPGMSDVKMFVKSFFSASPDLQKLGGYIRQVTPVDLGLELEMDTYSAKQRVLHCLRIGTCLQAIEDPDFSLEKD